MNQQGETRNPKGSSPLSSGHSDRLAAATLVGVMVMLAISFVNVWNLSRLGERVSQLEMAMGGGSAQGPDPSQVYEIMTAGAAAKGAEIAPVTIVEFADFQCPFCARARATLQQIEDTYGGSVRIVWKHLPLAIHADAVDASLAAEAAGNQGKFWEYHDLLFENQDSLGPDDLRRYAADLQLDMRRFEADLLDVGAKEKIETDVAEAESFGINATPGFFINGRFVLGALPFETFATIIDEELAKLNLPVPSTPS